MAEQRRPPKGSKAPPPYEEEEDSDVPTDVFHREALEDLESVPSQRAAAAIIRTRGGDQTTRDSDAAPKSPIEVEFVQQRGAAMPQAMWGMLDIYTKNRIYRVSSTMVCIEVIDRKTGSRAKDHPMLGARMGGGQRRSDHRVEVADPIPVPGMDVVFKQHGGKFGQTSRIERVVLRVRVSTFKVGDKEPSWEEITGQFALGKPKA
jgi:hypothetical protein